MKKQLVWLKKKLLDLVVFQKNNMMEVTRDYHYKIDAWEGHVSNVECALNREHIVTVTRPMELVVEQNLAFDRLYTAGYALKRTGLSSKVNTNNDVDVLSKARILYEKMPCYRLSL